MMDIDQAKADLERYLSNNPQSSVEIVEHDKVAIARPWGDESIFLEVPENSEALFEALNNLILAEQFTAPWHVDTQELEIIYTAFPLLDEQGDVKDRKFTFGLKSKAYVCHFAESSARLMELARAARFTGPSVTEHRNLPSFRYYLDAFSKPDADEELEGWRPTSFFVRGAEWNVEDILELVRHLNFYMSYYDSRSPRINIYPGKIEPAGKRRERYVIGKFPESIVGSELSSNLMHFWTASRFGDMFRRFLYCFQILEFASFYFIEDSVRRAVKKTLATPHMQDEVDNLIVNIIDSVQKSRIWDGGKMENLVKEVVNPEIIWREVEKNKDYFISNVDFDGGFQLKSLIVEKTTKEAFCHDWHTKFCYSIRPIRNALSHGKEQHMSAVITPTAQNFAKLQPWGELISIVAGEVIVYYNASV